MPMPSITKVEGEAKIGQGAQRVDIRGYHLDEEILTAKVLVNGTDDPDPLIALPVQPQPDDVDPDRFPIQVTIPANTPVEDRDVGMFDANEDLVCVGRSLLKLVVPKV